LEKKGKIEIKGDKVNPRKDIVRLREDLQVSDDEQSVEIETLDVGGEFWHVEAV